jgi:pimeloyl-ACP methyl ester carboxylesterase
MKSNLGMLTFGLLAGLPPNLRVEKAREIFPLTDFYDTPDSFVTTGKPGDLIRSMKFEGYNLPKGVEATRILYGTMSSQGDTVTCSGVVLVPPGEAPERGWPIIAWAHGTSGVTRRCAPSLMAECFDDYATPCVYTESGYAVVATDYVGLGTDYPVKYMDRISNGWDVIHGVTAARKAVPTLGSKWVAVGHSAGAHAMRGVAELEVDIDDPSYLGVVAVSGLGNVRTPMVVLSKEAGHLAVFMSEAVNARYPVFNQTEILTEKGLEVLETLRTACSGPGTPIPKEPPIKGTEIYIENWELNPYIEKYFKLDETKQEKYKGPVLVINGENEPPPVMKNDIEAAKRMREQGVDVQLEIIADANHFTLLRASVKEQMAWISDRFAGREIPNNCDTFLK